MIEGGYSVPLKIKSMNRGAQIVSASIIGADFVNVMVNGRCYTVFPPTVHKLAGAGMFLSDFGDEQTVRDVISSVNDSKNLHMPFRGLYKEMTNYSMSCLMVHLMNLLMLLIRLTLLSLLKILPGYQLWRRT